MAQFDSSIVGFEGFSAIGAVEEPYVESGVVPFFTRLLPFFPTSWTFDHAT